MKKILPYILIFVIIANFLAPFSITVNQNNTIKTKVAEVEAVGKSVAEERAKKAADEAYNRMISAKKSEKEALDEKDKVYKQVYDEEYSGPTDEQMIANLEKILADATKKLEMAKTTGDNIKIVAAQVDVNKAMADLESFKSTGAVAGTYVDADGVKIVGVKTYSTMPKCSLDPGTWFPGCVAVALYYILFVPTSYLFALTGVFFDNTFAYSVQDTSYRGVFVVEGWAVVRDICNMFFIFILLYIAIGTILKLHNVKTKDMIVNVVIIGLFINFSLFATQVIIDASNVLARVFYNADIIKITEKPAGGNAANGVANATPGLVIKSDGVIPLSAAIVNKVNPQNLIINSTKVGEVEDTAGVGNQDKDTVSAGTFILVTILTVAINIIGIITFISIGLMFVARVIGLWVAMIIAPLAFMTYAVPSLKGAKMIGWEKWWPDTIKLAFLAPVFIFFMYILLKFLETGLGMFGNQDKEGLSFVIATIIPFAFIMILLMKAKSIASDMSGELGQKITGAVAAAGGIALGGAALGTAFLGRKIVGQGLLASSSRTASATHYNNEKIKANEELAKWEADMKAGKAPRPRPTFVKPTHGDVIGKDKKGNDIKYKDNLRTQLGIMYNNAQHKTNDADRARHAVDEDMKSAGFEGVKYQELSGDQQRDVKEKVKTNNSSKYKDEAEREYRNDHGLNTIDPATKKLVDLTPDEKKKVDDIAKNKAVAKFESNLEKAAAGVNAFTRVVSKTNTGSWDVRKLSDIKADKNASIFSKIPVGLIAGVATGVRAGLLKSSGLSNGGVKVEGKFMEDLKSVIGDSLKGLKVTLPESHGDSHGGVKVGHGSDTAGGHH